MEENKHDCFSGPMRMVSFGRCRECGEFVILDEKSKIPDHEIWECYCGYPNGYGDFGEVCSIVLPIPRKLLEMEI